MAATAALIFAASGARPGAMGSEWSVPATTAITASDLSFSDGPVQLSGTLYAPKTSRKLPAVVVFHDASVPLRDSPLYSHLKQMLPPLGMAVFVYDRRGSGKSGGTLANSDYNTLADDGIAAERILARDPRIDSKRIGFWGLSQGGWLALLAAARSHDSAFAISVSAPMTTPDVQMNFAVANILRIKNYSQTDIHMAIATRSAVDDFERGKIDRAVAQEKVDEAAAKPWFESIYLGKTFQDPSQSHWAKVIKTDPMKTLNAIRSPILIIYGADDVWVPVKLSLEKLQAARHSNIDTAIASGAEHEMMLAVPAAEQIDPSKLAVHAPDSPEYFALIASWLTAHGFVHPRKG
jgi:dipeptidyl aminopeptidase/acylaminoacyl peptidase